MRIWPVLLATLLISVAAQAQQGAGLRGTAQPQPMGSAQVGNPLSASPGMDGSPYALPLIAPPLPPVQSSWALQDQLQAQCASRCARDYYFCLAGETPDTCSPDWGQCRALCSMTARRNSVLPR
jgi:hypothetical protein